jgi:Vitamin B12 dependent methionine synthase, activation domain
MKSKIFNFTFRELAISKEDVIRAMHGGAMDESHQFFLDILEQEFLRLKDYNGICGGYIETEEISFDAKTKTISIQSLEFNVGNIIFKELKQAEKMVVFTCTTGKELCDHIREENKTDVLNGFLIESLANLVVETAMDKIQDKMRASYGTHDLLISNRFSPGYCSWDVSEQHKLFKLLPEEFCGVSLSDSALMQPIKSISGFIGVGKNITYNHYKCKFCTQKQCIYKKTSNEKTH